MNLFLSADAPEVLAVLYLGEMDRILSVEATMPNVKKRRCLSNHYQVTRKISNFFDLDTHYKNGLELYNMGEQ